jgi:hypothetical protein
MKTTLTMPMETVDGSHLGANPPTGLNATSNRKNRNLPGISPLAVAFALLILLVLSVRPAAAHCDAENGPVATDARSALASGNLERAAIWVGPDQQEELSSTFDLALKVYALGGKAQALAERHFIETAVRLHRQAEGFPYTGFKPAQPLPPDMAAAERALETGDLEPLANLLTSEMHHRLHGLFEEAREAQHEKHSSLTAGRKWADAYVKYVTYVHGLYDVIQAGPSHGVAH